MTDYGWSGKILHIELDTGNIYTEPTSKYREYMGGMGMAQKIILDEAPMAGAFDPENRLIFAVGPLTGSPVPSSGRTEILGISPHVHAEGSKHHLMSRSSFGGYWGAELKFAGYDALVFKGSSGRPVYLYIHNGTAELRDASGLWGQDAQKTQELIRKELENEKIQVATIGPAGERKSRIAAVIHQSGNAAGQGGFGGVMGAKNLKAVAVRGTGGVNIADREGLLRFSREMRSMMPGPAGSTPLAKHGFGVWDSPHLDPTDINSQALRGNMTRSTAPFIEKYRIKNASCFGCPVACYSYHANVDGHSGKMACTQYFMAMMGNRDKGTFIGNHLANILGINTFEMFSMIQFIWYLQDTALDGRKLMELLFSQGLVDRESMNGLMDLHYPPLGKVGERGITTLMNMVARRQPFLGNALAEGFYRAVLIIAEKFEQLDLKEAAKAMRAFHQADGILGGIVGGHGGWGMSMHYDPRTFGYYWAVQYVIDNRDSNRHSIPNLQEWTGLDFRQSLDVARQYWGDDTSTNALNDIWRSPDIPLVWNGDASARANAEIARFIHLRGCIKDSLTVCDLVYPTMVSARPDREYKGDISLEYKYWNLVTGENIDQAELDRRAERIWNVHRLVTALEWGGGKRVNLREEHDRLPGLYFCPEEKRNLPPFPPHHPPHPPLILDHFEQSLTAYYELMGWDPETGLPRRSTLRRLNMTDVLNTFEKKAFPLSGV